MEHLDSPADEEHAADPLARTLRRVRRRLFFARWLRALSLDAVVFASIYAVLLGIERSFAFGWTPLATAAVVVASWVLVSTTRSLLFGRSSEQEAAVATDDRLRLKERISSAVYARDELRSIDSANRSGWGELVYSDGIRSLEGADVAKHFPLRLPRFVWLVLVPVSVAVAVWMWMPSLDLLGIDAERKVAEAMRRDIEKTKEDFLSELKKLEAKAEEERNTEIQKLLEAVRKQLGEQSRPKPNPGKTAESAAQQAKKEALTQIGKQIKKIDKQLSQNKKLETARQALERMQQTSLRGQKLTRKLSSALKRRDLESAKRELEKIQKEIDRLAKRTKDSNKTLSKEEQQKLRELADELARLARNMGPQSGLRSSMSLASKGLHGMKLDEALKGLQLSQEDLENLSTQQSQLETLEQAKQALQKAQQKLANVNKHSCPDCGKPRLAKPGQKPGGT